MGAAASQLLRTLKTIVVAQKLAKLRSFEGPSQLTFRFGIQKVLLKVVATVELLLIIPFFSFIFLLKNS